MATDLIRIQLLDAPVAILLQLHEVGIGTLVLVNTCPHADGSASDTLNLVKKFLQSHLLAIVDLDLGWSFQSLYFLVVTRELNTCFE